MSKIFDIYTYSRIVIFELKLRYQSNSCMFVRLLDIIIDNGNAYAGVSAASARILTSFTLKRQKV